VPVRAGDVFVAFVRELNIVNDPSSFADTFR